MSIIGDGCVVSRGEYASIFATGLAQNGNTVYAEKNGKRRNGKWTTIVSPNPAAHGLPDEYTEVSYIQGNGSQYIDTGVYANRYTRIVTQWQAIGAYNWQNIYGNCGGAQYSDFKFFLCEFTATTNQATYYVHDQTKTLTTSWTGVNTVDMSSSQIIVNGTSSAFGTIADFTSPYTIVLTGCTGYNNGKGGSPVRLFYTKLYNGITLTHDYIPCFRNSDNATGVFDLVTNRFLQNSGSGSYTLGTVIPTYLYTSGFLCEGIDEYGTWTVTATNGSKTTTKNVVIDAAEQFDILLKYSNNYGPLTATDFNSGTFAGDSGYFSYSLLTNQQDGSAGFTLTGKSNNNGRTKTPHWTSNITPNQHNSISFYAKKNANHGAAWIDVWQNGSYTQLWYVHYNNLPTSYTKYTVNISNVADGELRFSGGWFDATGNNSSSVSYCKIIFDE